MHGRTAATVTTASTFGMCCPPSPWPMQKWCGACVCAPPLKSQRLPPSEIGRPSWEAAGNGGHKHLQEAE
eukprot:6006141-Alexandrium_andersonii.AAC.1